MHKNNDKISYAVKYSIYITVDKTRIFYKAVLNFIHYRY